ncbi:MAG: NADPH:quinone reductase [Gammaproteobacteria bacterium]|nr:NADPH:quinone reductase [Gammaproteobacteria bacterium]MDH3468179.1 NADPH:quinone reductase [Gammaproteobacteria bacterium]
MKAAWFEEYGAAAEVLQVGERGTPTAGDGEVLVRLYASSVNPSDVKKRAGLQPALDKGWVIPHSDGAGVIEAVGNGVDSERIAERVWVYQAQYQRRFGTAAEYVALPAERAIHLPDNTDFAIGACMGIPAMTAHRCVYADGPVAGETVLITGAAGRVGDYAVQWAKDGGANVIGTVGNETSAARARDTGCDLVLNYRVDNVAERAMDFTSGQGVSRVIDVEFGLNIATSIRVIRPNGVIVSYASAQAPQPQLPFYPMMFKDLSVRMVLVYAMPEQAKRRAAEDITSHLKQQNLKHRVAERYSLDAIAKAHESIENGGVAGCVVVEIA